VKEYLDQNIFLNASEVIYYLGFIQPILEDQIIHINPTESIYRKYADMFGYNENDFKTSEYLCKYGEKDQKLLELAVTMADGVDVIEIAAMEKIAQALQQSAAQEAIISRIQLQ
jgi:hypothetical protein